jgi:DinB superfamily
MENVQYPIGKFESKVFSTSLLEEWLLEIEVLPKALEFSIQNLDAHQLEEPYRPDGWTIKQVVHHVADSHMNALVRIKLALTENNPTIKPYEEAYWANLIDVQVVPINVSLTIVHAIHAKMLALFKNMSISDFEKTIYHPANKNTVSLWDMLGTYVWHGRHHVAHINNLRARNGWR